MTWKQFVKHVEEQIAANGIDISRTRVEVNYIEVVDFDGIDEVDVQVDKTHMPEYVKVTVF